MAPVTDESRGAPALPASMMRKLPSILRTGVLAGLPPGAVSGRSVSGLPCAGVRMPSGWLSSQFDATLVLPPQACGRPRVQTVDAAEERETGVVGAVVPRDIEDGAVVDDRSVDLVVELPGLVLVEHDLGVLRDGERGFVVTTPSFAPSAAEPNEIAPVA